MLLAWLTFHPLMSWFTAEAWWNIRPKYLTCPTCHEPRGWLKLVASWNIQAMLVTLETSHALMPPSSKPDLPRKSALMSVTAVTSHAEIGPNRSRADVALLDHSVRASSRYVLALKVNCHRDGFCASKLSWTGTFGQELVSSAIVLHAAKAV